MLKCDKKNPAFVWESGRKVTVADMSKIVKEVMKIQKVQEAKKHTAYSLRIGGTSRAQNVGINHPKILKFIRLTDGRLPHVAYRYMRFSEEELAQKPYKIIHGPIKTNEFTQVQINLNENSVFVPWNKNVNLEKCRKQNKKKDNNLINNKICDL